MEKERPGKSGLVTVQFHPQETFIQSWNVNNRTLIESKHIDKIHDIDEDWKTLKKEINSLNPKPARNITVMLITDEWSNTKTPSEIGEIAFKLQHRLDHPIEIADADEMAAVTTWESIGADLPEKEQFKWVKRSRVVCLGVYDDHTGIALVESGRIIGGLSLPQEAYPWHNIMLRNLEKNGIDFHRYLIRKAIDDFVKPMYSPDITVVYVDDPTVRLGYKNDDPTVHVIGERDEEDKRKDAGYGALLHWIKEQIGWRAFFIDDAIKDEEESQDIVSLTIGGDEEDDPDLVAQIHDMMKNITQDNDEFAIKDDPIVIPSPETTTDHQDVKPSNPYNENLENDSINEIISTGYETDDESSNNLKTSKDHSINEVEPVKNPFITYAEHDNNDDSETTSSLDSTHNDNDNQSHNVDESESIMVDFVNDSLEVDKVTVPVSTPDGETDSSSLEDSNEMNDLTCTDNDDTEQDVVDNDDSTYDGLEIDVMDDKDVDLPETE